MKTVTIEVPDDVFERAERRAGELGLTLAGEVDQLVRRFGESDDRASAVVDYRDQLQTALAALAQECRLPNWDGQGATSVRPETLHHSKRFARALPAGVREPSVGVEADGHLTLEWYRDPHWLISVSVSPESELFYAALFGTSDVRGREDFANDVPEIILNLIRRVDVA
jgi:hypothetical protein